MVLAVAIGALSMALAAGAFGKPGKGHQGGPNHHGKHSGAPLINESLAPSHVGDPMFHGVSPGGLPWALSAGNVRVKRDGKFDLRVKGLVIPAMGRPGPVTTISASLYCGPDSNTVAAGTTQRVPISSAGNARIFDRSLRVPHTCLAPEVLVHPNGIATLYIALDGWRP
jgi:hypothetical protein